MRLFAAADERRLTLLEMKVGALLEGRERMGERIRKLREYIAAHCKHSPFPEDCEDDDCPTCWFLKEDAR